MLRCAAELISTEVGRVSNDGKAEMVLAPGRLDDAGRHHVYNGWTGRRSERKVLRRNGHDRQGALPRILELEWGLAQQGYPISGELQEVDKDGVVRTTQYFERAVFEYHQEYAGTPNEVLLSLLGVFYYDRKKGRRRIADPWAGGAPTGFR
jgi:hypothetical protein